MQLALPARAGLRPLARGTLRRTPSVAVHAMARSGGEEKRKSGPQQRTRAVGSPGVNWSNVQENNPQVAEAVESLKAAYEDALAKWDTVQDKKTTLALVAGSVAGVFLFNWVLSWLNYLPVLPDLFTFIGLIVSANFFWSFVLFKSGRDSLKDEAETLYTKLRAKLDGEEDTTA